MLTFESPFYGIIFLSFPLLIYYCHFKKNQGNRLTYSFSFWGKRTLKSINSKIGNILDIFSYVIIWISFSFIILSLMGPTYSNQRKVYLDKGIDLFFVLDESPTMGALDFGKFSRFETAKSIIQDYLDKVENDSVGIITFATETSVRSPLTQNYKFLKDKIQNLFIMDLGDKTAIGNAIAIALVNIIYGISPTKIIILMTDGVLNYGTSQINDLLILAKKLGIRIYTVGIGTNEEVSVDYKTRSGEHYRGTIKDSYDEKFLKMIAQKTEAQFFKASSSYLLSQAISKISYLEKTEKRVSLEVKHEPLVFIFTLIALAFLSIYVIIRFFFMDAFL